MSGDIYVRKKKKMVLEREIREEKLILWHIYLNKSRIEVKVLQLLRECYD